MKHAQLKQKVLDALNALHGDTSVELEQTRLSLEEVQEEISTLVACLDEDIHRRDNP